MRGLLRAIPALALMLVPLTACSHPQAAANKDYLNMTWDQVVAEAKSEGELVAASWWGEEFWKEATKQFQDKYGIKTRYVIGNNPIDKILAEKDRAVGTIDVNLIGGPGVKTSIDADLWYGPVLPKVPAGAKLDPKLSKQQEGVQTKGYLVPIYRNQTTFLYDPDKVPNPPQTWAEFEAWIDAHPKQFAYADPNKAGSGQAFVQAVIANVTGGIDKYAGDEAVDSAKVADWSKVWQWLNARKDKLTLAISNSESIDLVNQGTVSMAIAWDDDSEVAITTGQVFKRAKNYIPKFGLAGGGDSAGLLKNAPHKAAGLLFLDFLTSNDGQVLLNKILGSVPARTDLTSVPSVITEDERANRATVWVPAAYKAELIKQFTANVLLK